MAEVIFIILMGIFVAVISKRLVKIVKKDLAAEKLGWRVEAICFGAAASVPVMLVSIFVLVVRMIALCFGVTI